MSGYTKLFNSIVASTIWREDDKTRIVWITMLAMADKHGVVEGSIPGLADIARVTVEECRASISNLQSPDPDSRSREEDGRRILPVEGGWRLVNHGKYREKMGSAERREYLKNKQRERRSKNNPVNTVSTMSTNVNTCKQMSTLSTPSTISSGDGDGDERAKLLKGTVEAVESKNGIDLVTKARIVLGHLNDVSGRKYQETSKNLTIASERLKETNEDVDGIRKMIDRQAARWKGTEQEEYLRPSTIFRQSNFCEYFASRDLPVIRPGSAQQNQYGNRGNHNRAGQACAPGDEFVSGRDAQRAARDAVIAEEFLHRDDEPPL